MVGRMRADMQQQHVARLQPGGHRDDMRALAVSGGPAPTKATPEGGGAAAAVVTDQTPVTPRWSASPV